MRTVLSWLKTRTENMAVAMLTVMFISFIVQIFSRYILNNPVSWTVEVCLTMWIWVVFWGGAFLIDDARHVRFDVLYSAVRPGIRRVFALISATAIVAALLLSLPATVDYVTFMAIETSATLDIRLDWVFSVYVFFVATTIVRYACRAVRLARGDHVDAVDGVHADRAP